MRLSSGIIEDITEAHATVRVAVGDRETTGSGSIYLSDLWAWPDQTLSHAERDSRLRKRCTDLARDLPVLCGAPAHPLELGLRLHNLSDPDDGLPALAASLCVSPFDAAIHDATGYATGMSAFSFYQESTPIPGADRYFPNGACVAIREMLRSPAGELEGWWIVNAHDNIDANFTGEVRMRGFRNFKVKLLGANIDEDVGRTVEIFRTAKRTGVQSPRLSADSNEAHASANAVACYLHKLSVADPEAYAAMSYLEQPTHRDIRRAAFDWREVAACKPVILDEGLVSMDLLPLAVEQGWSGLAVKTCKGHSFMLAAAAWAHKNGLSLTMQDLTNPGIAAIHSFLMAAHLPTINGIELNSPQFTPQANEDWQPRLNSLFEARDGRHRMDPVCAGLGSKL